MTSIVELFPKCRKLAYDARQQWSQVQKQQQQQQLLHPPPRGTHHPNGSSSSSIRIGAGVSTPAGTTGISELCLILDELHRQLALMDDLVLHETTPLQRDLWKRKIGELRIEAQSLTHQVEAAQQQQRYHYNYHHDDHHHRYASERDELGIQSLRQRRRNPHDHPITGGGVNVEEGERDLHHLAQEGSHLHQSQQLVGSLLYQGEASLQSLVEQRQQLSQVRNWVASMGDTLGLTQSAMTIIERRDITDAYFVAAGMVVTLLVIYFVWF